MTVKETVAPYEQMLDKAYEQLPDSVFEKHRFEIPNVRGHQQGNRTVISNFNQIASHLGRQPAHLLKYLLKELATPGTIKDGLLVVGTKVPASRLNEKIKKYADEFVLCSECGKPDTRIEKEKNVRYLKCTACGAKHAIRSAI